MHKRAFVIPKDHPAIPGHFPGNPVVPGAVLLDCVRQTVTDAYPAARIAAIGRVKFLIPVHPGREFVVQLRIHGNAVAFRCSAGDVVFLQGSLSLEKAAP